MKQSSALPSRQYRVTNKHKTRYAEQWFEDGNNWVIDTGGRSNEVRPRIYLFVGMGRINKLESKMLCEVVTSLKFWRVCLASPRLLRQYRKF